MTKVAVIGTTSWGITLAVMLARRGQDVRLWARTGEEALSLKTNGPNQRQFPGLVFPPSLGITSDLGEALSGVDAILLVVPSQTMRQNIKLASRYLESQTLIISAAKGLEAPGGQRMSEVISEEIAAELRDNVCVLSGPNLYQEIARGLPAATVIAAADESVARKAQKIIQGDGFCVYTNADVVGVELGGALKNIIALGAGMVDGLGLGDNAKAAFITRGLTEMTAFAVSLGASPLTLAGLAGLGDLMATCASPLSRNHYLGFELAKGRTLEETIALMNGVAEGVVTLKVVRGMAKKLKIEMPTTEKLYSVLYEGADARKLIIGLLGIQGKNELSGRRWKLASLFKRR